MWGNKPGQPNVPGAPAPVGPEISQVTPADVRAAGAGPRNTAWLGPTVQIKGEISGNEDLQIEGKVEGSISLGGHRLTVGRTADVHSDVVAREVVVYGKMQGDLRARDRIEIRKDGTVVGDIATARIMVEDGAYFKGSIEIDRSHTEVGSDLDTLLARGSGKPK